MPLKAIASVSISGASFFSNRIAPVSSREVFTIFARISYRLSRLYGIMQENRRKVDEERQELQMLVSDAGYISLHCPAS